MTAWCAGLMTIALVTTGSIVTGPKQSLQRIPRDDDSSEASTTSANLCPCTQGCCDDHWFQYKDACFLPVSQPQIWRQAEKNCKEEHDAHLASVHSQEENNFIFYLMGQQEEYWLGAWRTEGPSSDWRWTDNSTWQYEAFRPNMQPQYMQHHILVEKSHRGKVFWKFEHGHQWKTYICKYFLE